mmetsp:Transcript_12862/g.21759  ORF Transcript_12862/g.21759 Transcript_12862/m.21759 type:complete len:91 (-) Transcript_12862:139-411(-)
MYIVYAFYGFASMSFFNILLSTLDYFNEAMPDYNPSFFLNLGLNIAVVILMNFVILYSHRVSFPIRNNFMILAQIPLTIAIPVACHLLND